MHIQPFGVLPEFFCAQFRGDPLSSRDSASLRLSQRAASDLRSKVHRRWAQPTIGTPGPHLIPPRWKLRNGTGNSWDLYIAHTTEPGSSWNHVDNTGNLSAFWGTPESELSRYGTADANDDVPSLQEQDNYLGSWVGWQHMGCDYSQDSITDWAVNKANESQWYMVHTAPVPGQC